MIVDRACIFRLEERFFAFPGDDVQEVTEIGKLSPVPRSSAVLLGLVASRGLIYPLLDLGLKLKQDKKLLSLENSLDSNEFSPDDITPKNKPESRQQGRHALIVRDGEGEIALAVDEVIGYESQVSTDDTDDTDMRLEIAAALGVETSKKVEEYPSYYQGDLFYFSGQEVMMLKLNPLLDAMTIEVI